jgi:hypothetical protein
MNEDMRNAKQGPGNPMGGVGSGHLTASELAGNTIKAEIEKNQCTLQETRELLGTIESMTNEICGPEDNPEMKSEQQDPFSLLSYMEDHTMQLQQINRRIGTISRRLRETLG